MPSNVPKAVTDDVLARDGWTCALCGVAVADNRHAPHPLSLAFDYIVPVALGGDNTAENLRVTHLRCKMSQGDDTRDEPAFVGDLWASLEEVVPEVAQRLRESRPDPLQMTDLPEVGPGRIAIVYDDAVAAARSFAVQELRSPATELEQWIRSRDSSWPELERVNLRHELAVDIARAYEAVLDSSVGEVRALNPFCEATGMGTLASMFLDRAGLDDLVQGAIDAVLRSPEFPLNWRTVDAALDEVDELTHRGETEAAMHLALRIVDDVERLSRRAGTHEPNALVSAIAAAALCRKMKDYERELEVLERYERLCLDVPGPDSDPGPPITASLLESRALRDARRSPEPR